MQAQSILRTRTAARTGILLIALASALWGTVGIATQALYTISATNAFSIGFFRLALSVPALAIACWLFCGRSMFRITKRDWALIVVIGVLAAIYQVCLFSAIRFVGVSVAVVVTLCTAPVFIAVASTRLFHERFTRWIALALACALTGTLLISGQGGGVASPLGATIAGVALALGSALGYSGMTLISRVLAPRYHPLQPITFGFAVGAVVLLPFALAQGLVVTYPLAGWALLLHLGLVPTALGYVLWLFGMRSVTATTSSVISLIEPLTATVLAWLLFGERFSGSAFVGAVLLLAAIMLLYRNEVEVR